VADAYIVDAVRTSVGKRGGALADVHSADLAAHTLGALVDRTGIDPAAVDDVILGCCDTIGSQAGDVARTAWLVAGLPDHVPGVTIDRQCGSSQQAVHFAAQGVMSGTQDLVVAGGVQNMSAIPISAAMLVGQQYGFSTPFAESPGWQARYGDQEVSQFRSAEMIAEKWDISRLEMEEFALASHERARTAIAEGRFEREIVAVGDFDTDQCPRETSMEKMAGLEPLAPGGRITAAVASQICDASSALLIASEQAVADHGLTARARIHHLTVTGDKIDGYGQSRHLGLEVDGPHPRVVGVERVQEAGQHVDLVQRPELGRLHVLEQRVAAARPVHPIPVGPPESCNCPPRSASYSTCLILCCCTLPAVAPASLTNRLDLRTDSTQPASLRFAGPTLERT